MSDRDGSTGGVGVLGVEIFTKMCKKTIFAVLVSLQPYVFSLLFERRMKAEPCSKFQ